MAGLGPTGWRSRPIGRPDLPGSPQPGRPWHRAGVESAAIVRFDQLAGEILARPARLGQVRLVAVDGPSGAGKSTFAVRLAAALRTRGAAAAVVGTDDLLDGWDDIVEFWPRLESLVLAPLRRGEPASYRRYDWNAGRFGNKVVTVPVPDVLILEGVTATRAAIRPELTTSVFVTAGAPLRLDRVLHRDGAHVRDLLLRWFAAETEHFATDRTRDHAEFVVDGTSQVRHDPTDTFIRLDRGEVSDDHR